MSRTTKDDTGAEARERGYEGATPKISIPAISAVALLALVLAAILLMVWLFYGLVAYEDARDPGPPPMASSRTQPVGLRLLPDSPGQVRHQRAVEDALLTTYAWVDRENGFVRIPVDRALDLVARRGLPEKLSSEAKP